MNRIIHRSTLTSRFVSMFYGELELNGVFIYVNAGHPPPFHLGGDGTVTYLEAGGPVLGPLAEASYERGFVIMKPGDVLVFYTDGIVEARGRVQPEAAGPAHAGAPPAPPAPANVAGPSREENLPLEEYGLARLLRVARRQQGKPSQALVEAVFADLEEWSGGAAPEDDRTMMVIALPSEDKAVTAAFPRPIGLI